MSHMNWIRHCPVTRFTYLDKRVCLRLAWGFSRVQSEALSHKRLVTERDFLAWVEGKCVLSVTAWLQYSFPPRWPLHKSFVGGKKYFCHSFRAQHCAHFRQILLRGNTFSVLNFLLPLASFVWELKINSTVWLPFCQPSYCTCCRQACLLRPYITYV